MAIIDDIKVHQDWGPDGYEFRVEKDKLDVAELIRQYIEAGGETVFFTPAPDVDLLDIEPADSINPDDVQSIAYYDVEGKQVAFPRAEINGYVIPGPLKLPEGISRVYNFEDVT